MNWVDPQRTAQAPLGGTAPLAPLTTVAAWQAYRGSSPGKATHTQPVLDTAIAQFRGITGQHISRVDDDEATWYQHRRRQHVITPEQPIISVTSLAVDGVTWVEGRDYVIADKRMGMLRVYWAHRPFRGTIAITYSHGWDPVPDDALAVVYALAEQLLENPQGERVSLERLGDYQVQYDADQFTQVHRTTIERYADCRPLVS